MLKRTIVLIKKDCLLLGRNLYTCIGLAILIPVFIAFGFSNTTFGSSATITAFMSGSLYTWLISYFYLALEEAKAPKAYFLLVSIYTKKELVISRYLFCLLIFLACTVFFIPISLIFNNWFPGNLLLIIFFGLSFSIIIFGIYMPATYKWDIDINKYLLSVILLVFSMGSIPIINFFVSGIINSKFPHLNLLLVFVGSIIILFCSIAVSIRILKNKK
jgi:ABC-2 type transport system permease protein